MINIKKIIDIILITIAIIAVVIFADRIISFKNLDASPGAVEKNTETASNTVKVKEEEKVEYDFKMVIDKNLFSPVKDIFTIVPDKNAEDMLEEEGNADTDNSSIGQEVTGVNAEATQDNTLVQGNEEPDGDAETLEEVSGTEKSLGNIDYSNSRDFRIEVDLVRQRVIVFYKDEVLREMICSGGAPDSPTPPGEYVTTEKIEYAWIDRFGVGAYYWIRFFEDYLIHSVPFDENGEMIVEEFEKLGNPASHGCIRLKLEEARWLYDSLPLGVKVIIY
jgi:lipoprotein-anchoring transpeptidase ErfK/SrfK